MAHAHEAQHQLRQMASILARNALVVLRKGKGLILACHAENESPSAPTSRRSSLRSALRSASPALAPEATPQSAQSRPRRAKAAPVSQVRNHALASHIRSCDGTKVCHARMHWQRATTRIGSWGLQQYQMPDGGLTVSYMP